MIKRGLPQLFVLWTLVSLIITGLEWAEKHPSGLHLLKYFLITWASAPVALGVVVSLSAALGWLLHHLPPRGRRS